MKRKLKIFILLLPVFVFAYIGIQLFVPAYRDNIDIEVQIPEGATYKQAINILVENNLIRDKNLFIILGRLTDIDRKVRAGYYLFGSRITPWDVFQQLRKGKIIEYEVTVVEGDSLSEIGKKLSSSRIMSLDKFNALVRDSDFIDSIDIDAPSLEGYLFPQTYKLPKGTSPDKVFKLMVQKLREAYDEKLMERSKEFGWSENEVLTLASIIEKEAVTDAERALISAVYHNRIKKGMPLQADPTAIYGVKSFSRKIKKSDLKIKTPYNTYVIKGLPPGPIASPGLKSIIAALYPAEVPYIYFVSKRNGTHIFSKTLSEHNTAIARIKASREEKEEDALDDELTQRKKANRKDKKAN
ncbi:MAG: endolytic transglycosylase MltG [Thermodesulfovibrio sp.]|nr:endolytic transglycosylase MltG [Thermodesulfovibrio sp.]